MLKYKTSKFELNLALMYTPSFKSLKISAIINIKKKLKGLNNILCNKEFVKG